MTPAERFQQLQDLAAQGKTRSEVAAAIGVKINELSITLTILGIKLDRKNRDRADKIRLECASGVPRKVVAFNHNVTTAAVCKIVNGLSHRGDAAKSKGPAT
jgi:hypothetical protein